MTHRKALAAALPRSASQRAADPLVPTTHSLSINMEQERSPDESGFGSHSYTGHLRVRLIRTGMSDSLRRI